MFVINWAEKCGKFIIEMGEMIKVLMLNINVSKVKILNFIRGDLEPWIIWMISKVLCESTIYFQVIDPMFAIKQVR